ncbi:Outer membrane protein, partial [hydrothermal vent metagenome]
MNRRTLILSTTAIGIGAFGTATWWATRPGPAQDTSTVAPEVLERLERAYSPVLGPADAPVTIVEFFDPACEACRAFHPVIKDIMAQYPDDVRVVIRYTPFHGQSSQDAIMALEAARLQGVFFPVMEALLTYQNAWARRGAPVEGKIMSIAGAAGLDVTSAEAQMKMPDVVAVFNQDQADVKAVGISQT